MSTNPTTPPTTPATEPPAATGTAPITNPVPPATTAGASGQTVVTTPAAAIKGPNHFVAFFKKIGHAILDIFKWAPSFAQDVVTVIEEEEELTPEFKAGLKTLISDSASLVALASTAVTEKGINPTQDLAVVKALEQLVKDFGNFAPVVQSAVAILEGKGAPTTTTSSTTESTS